jgi:hypothetical protein
MKVHELKTDPDYFQKSYQGVKTFEIRFNDRDYQVGDGLRLHETKYTHADMVQGAPLEYTGRYVDLRITYIMHGPNYGLAKGWVAMSVK